MDSPPLLSQPAARLWLFFASAQAYTLLAARNLDAAETTYTRIQELLEAQPEMAQEYLASLYHNLGRLALERGRFDDAEGRYRHALTLYEDLGDQSGLAITHHELGWVAQERGRLDEAEASIVSRK